MFVEKLNKKQEGVYVIEEEKDVANGIWEGYLNHDNVNHETIYIYTGPKFSGEKVENYFISTPSETPWKTHLKVFSNSEKIYITYESKGDQVEAEDINLVQESIVDTRTELEQYKVANDNIVGNLDTRLVTVENGKAEKTYVDTELMKKADKSNTYTKAETDSRIQAIIGTAPEALDTLAEIAEALNNDPDFAATVTNLLAQKVDKVAGKGLSTEDYTTAEKIKLAGIEEEANKYIHPNTHPASIIVQDSTHRFVTDSEKDKWNNKAELSDIPTKVSQLENDAKYVTQIELGEAGYGDMLKAIYDSNDNGKVDVAETAEKVEWNDVVNKPSTFPPSSHNHDERYIQNTGGTIQNGDLYMDGGSVNYIRPDTTGGWARGFWWSKRDLTRIGGIGVLGSGETISKFYIGFGISPWLSSIIEIFSDSVNINGTIKQQGNEVWHKGKPLTWNDLKGV